MVAAACLFLAACAGSPDRPGADPGPPDSSGSPGKVLEYWPLAPDLLADGLRSGPIEILSEEGSGGGTTGATKVQVRLEDHDQKLFAKWKAAGLGLDGVNNSPRKEIAAYLVQKLVVDPEAYVVPPSVARCVPTSDFPDPKGHKITRLSGAQCELGVFSVWLQNVTLPDVLFDSERFARDPVYARHMATFNLVTYLLYHQDGRRGNFLVSKNDADRRVFAIDNGVAFSGVFYNWFVPNWKAIRVPALPPEGVERLRRIGKGDLDHLAVVAQLERGEDGIFRSVPHTAPIDEDDGARVEGGVVQFGLTDDEIEDLYERIEELLEDVDEGEIGLLPPASR